MPSGFSVSEKFFYLAGVPEFAGLSRARIQALIELGGVLINGREVYAAQRCRPGIRISVPAGHVPPPG